MVKRFSVIGVTRDKEYTVTKGTPGSKVLYFTANPNGEAEGIRVELKPKPRLKKSFFDFNFAEISIKGRNSMGNTLTKFAVRKIEQRQEGISTLGSLNIWYDETVQRLNTDDRGVLLGAFSGTDRIITVMQSGHYRLNSFDLSAHFDEDMIIIEKYRPDRVYTAIYQERESKQYYIKRFKAELTDKKVEFVENSDKLILFTADPYPRLELIFDVKLKAKGAEQEELVAHEFIGVKGYKAKGKRLSVYAVKKLSWLEPLQIEEPLLADSADDTDLETISSEQESQVDTILEEELSDLPTTDPRLKFRLDSVEPAEVKSEDELNVSEEIAPLKGLTVNTESSDESLPQAGQPHKKRGRKKNQEPTSEKTGGDEEPGDAIQMELPL